MKVFIAGGGTGGHFYPALAVAESLKEKGAEIHYFGTEKGIEGSKDFPADKKRLFPISGVRGKGLGGLVSAYGLLKTAFQIKDEIKRENPDFILCFGGYASLPLGLASVMAKKPLFLHEQNSIPSYTNKLLSRFARKVFITFPYSSRFFPPEKTVLSGLPVRKSLKEDLKLTQEEARRILGVGEGRTVLVFGGSQGARKLSQTALLTAEKMEDLRFILIGGKHFPRPERLPQNVKYFSYIDRMGLAYRSADAVVCRSGAGSVYEVILSGRYGVFVPFPHAVSNHQYYNAVWLQEKGVATVVEERELTPQRLEREIGNALSKGLEQVEKKLKNITIYDAEKVITDRILNEIGRL
ncbi:MAG: undecaprenyldiphospho-muramoylpentapeptide beta-N-acetylglucosaminyltransferase [Aquificae bacterium]|nr:undecaprenyldiphospho-muramoylpentapeptide beta-N-acetylglucosaminyltransferase [Aquificota bacterium]